MKQKVVRKLRSCILLLLAWMGTLKAEISPFVIDHSSVDIERIPLYWIEKVKQDQVLIQCVGQSHSYQYEFGLRLLEQNNPRFAVQIAENIGDINTGNRLYILRSQYNLLYNRWATYYGDDSDYWSTDEGREMVLDTAGQLMAEGYSPSASIWCWCWDICNPSGYFSQPNDFTEEHLGWYLDAIAQFNAEPTTDPSIFVYHTSVSDCSDYGNPNGPWRVTYMNGLIRQAVAEASGILIDQADIENWNIDNTEQYITTDGYGRTIYPRHPDYNESNPPDTMTGDHANDALCLRKAAAIWYLAARLAGWNGCEAIEGDVTGDCKIDFDDFEVLCTRWLESSESSGWNPVADLWPAGGDGVIDFWDFSVLSQAWQRLHCTQFNIADFNRDCQVNISDMLLFVQAWLEDSGSANWNGDCDLSPEAGGGGRIDLADFAVLAGEWQKESQ